MYNADRVRETSTTSGAITTSSTITLAGAVAQYQSFNSRVATGDQCEFAILDAGGSVWLTGVGTITNATTLTINTLLDSSAGVATGVTLTAGTHTVILTATAAWADSLLVMTDRMIDHVVSGLVIPTSGTLAATASAGVAYVLGRRVVKAAQAHTYTASKDTYVDLDNTLYTYVAVTNGAGAPALTANAIRIAKVVTSASAVTSVVQTGVDSNGVNIYNNVSQPFSNVSDSGGQTISNATFTDLTFNTNVQDNDGIHSTSVNTNRFTIVHPGVYMANGFCGGSFAGATRMLFRPLKNGSTVFGGTTDWVANSGGNGSCEPSCFGMGYLAAGDYVTFNFYQGSGGSITLTTAGQFGQIVRIA